jgi:hypothetical protein
MYINLEGRAERLLESKMRLVVDHVPEKQWLIQVNEGNMSDVA